MLGFVAGRKRKESNKWDKYLIDKRDLADQIIYQMETMIKEIKPTDKISDSRTVINENFFNLDERLKRVEERAVKSKRQSIKGEK